MSEWLPIIRSEPLTYFLKAITFLGNEEFLYIALPVLYWIWRKRAGAHLMILVILSAYINFLIKGVFAWERPPSDLWLIHARGYTFPSSHAVTVTVMWGFLALEVKKKWFSATAASLIILVAISRVYLGVHYPQDVIAGIATGLCLLFAYRLWLRYSRSAISKINTPVKIISVFIISILMILINTTSLSAAGAGMFAGVVIGFLIEPLFADFTTEGKLLKKILRTIVGAFFLVIIWQGLVWLLPKNIWFKWFESIVIGLWITLASTWIFVQLKLADRES